MEKSEVSCLIEDKNKEILYKVDRKVDFKLFVWIVGSLTAIFVSMISFLYGRQSTYEEQTQENTIKVITQLTELKTSSQTMSTDVSELKKEIKELNRLFPRYDIVMEK